MTARTAARRTARRKMALLKRAGLFGSDTKGATIRRAYSADDLSQAYRLVHDVFLGTGYMRPEPCGIRLRMFETAPETATFIAEKDKQVVGVLSVVMDSSELGLPSDSAFKSELTSLRGTGMRICELTNQAVAEEFRQSAVPTELMRCAVAHSIQAGYHESVATVSPGHEPFYELLGFRRLGGERSYSQKLHDPVVALTMDLDRYRHPVVEEHETAAFLHDFGNTGNHFLHRVVDWSRQAQSHFQSPDLLRELFVINRNFLGECSRGQLEILKRSWGQETFREVARGPDRSFKASLNAANLIPALWDDESVRNLFEDSELAPALS